MTADQNERFARSLAEFGTPRHLPHCDGWVLERDIPGTSARDAMGCYPLFTCRDWARLGTDLDELRGELVSLGMVADPFGNYSAEELRDVFVDSCHVFKRHFVVDLSRPVDSIPSRHHRYYARRAGKELQVEVCDEPLQFLDDWVELYGTLTERHGITGIRAFSRDAFAQQLVMPQLVMLRAVHASKTVGAHLWTLDDGVATSYLAASSRRGYELMAAYALYAKALEHFSRTERWMNLGAGAGMDSDAKDGLTRFKRGWSTGVRNAYFCGRILNPNKYRELAAPFQEQESSHFPRYRAREYSTPE